MKFPLCERAGLEIVYTPERGKGIRAIDVEKLLESAPVVYGGFKNGKPVYWSHVCDTDGSEDTHTARLIMVEPIVKESRERQLLRTLIETDVSTRSGYDKYHAAYDEAKKLLGDE